MMKFHLEIERKTSIFDECVTEMSSFLFSAIPLKRHQFLVVVLASFILIRSHHHFLELKNIVFFFFVLFVAMFIRIKRNEYCPQETVYDCTHHCAFVQFTFILTSFEQFYFLLHFFMDCFWPSFGSFWSPFLAVEWCPFFFTDVVDNKEKKACTIRNELFFANKFFVVVHFDPGTRFFFSFIHLNWFFLSFNFVWLVSKHIH